MRLRLLALLPLALAGTALSAGFADMPAAYSELPPGRYSVGVHGMLCTVCARAIAAEWGKLPEVEKAVLSFEKEQGVVTIRLDSSIKVNDLYKGLRRAERLANMGGHYELREIKYLP
ncbi:MAG: heavy-metal-associated domain-containing protein [Elusimicrobia bacterium]|nr:heavy-metal-associated domain-containing protein [Elusimicrobiota bacterium]MDE2510017.1 heavy-metal-associated domain-containing protein [Elusimicrobiota bacterium]